jgi:hypothetical protein
LLSIITTEDRRHKAGLEMRPMSVSLLAAIRTEPPLPGCSSEQCGSVLGMASDEPRAATVSDPDGHGVALLV